MKIGDWVSEIPEVVWAENRKSQSYGGVAGKIQETLDDPHQESVETCIESQEKIFEDLRISTFRINSIGWEKRMDETGILYSINSEGDVIEFLEGELQGEQLFTYDAMVRETRQVGKRTPTNAEWKHIAALAKNKAQKENSSVIETIGIKLAGIWNASAKRFFSQGKYCCYWSLSPSPSDNSEDIVTAVIFELSNDKILINLTSRATMHSVLCIGD